MPSPRAAARTTSRVGADGIVWYTAQRDGQLGRLDPATGKVDLIAARRGRGAARRDHRSRRRALGHRGRHQLHRPRRSEDARGEALAAAGSARLRQPQHRDVRQAAAASGSPARTAIYGRLDPATGEIRSGTRRAAAGRTASPPRPTGDVYYASLAGSHIARVDLDDRRGDGHRAADRRARARGASGPTRRAAIWVSEWNSGQRQPLRPADGSLEDLEAARVIGRRPTRSTSTSRTRCG